MANSKHSCVDTKVMAMKSRMLTKLDYQALIREPDVAGVLSYLKSETYYAPFLKDVDTLQVHRQAVEIPLNRMKIQQIEKILHYLSGMEKGFIKTFLIRADIEALRILIRGMARGENLESLAPLLVYSKEYTNIDFEHLLKAGDWESFKKVLVHTEYFRILEIYKTVSIDEDLFPIEKSLERYYYDKLKWYLDRLDQRENKALITTMRKGIDLLNLIWLYRGKKFYNLSREELLAYSLRGGLRIKMEGIQKMAEVKDMDTLLQMMESYDEYKFLFNHRKTIDLYMERRRERFLYFAFLNLFHKNDSGIGKVVAFIRLTEFEIEDVTSIIESKRYRMSIEETEKFLIRYFD
ncbi:V-type ATPase subunit [Eubacterium barkeri]|uniref:V/A-type H+-transporting ATPase subunit C n=1 Tax=Eubacterium barkeri TaxID=1528 RepID=A0A1H3BYK0_EUBBA|nr:V-type ATPase subunit [Eubacterium barkeri]SDX46946.1 V/A-type H+-transporting ATPase subunit C [Eubacterium barkeri]